MSALLFASALLALAPRAPLTLTVDAKDGEVIFGERSFRVTVVDQSAINKVEFYVNNELREDDSSTPYEFKIDTISETEGPIKLRFKAYTVESKSAEKTLTLTIDNELGKGAAYHVDKGNELLGDGKYAEARDQGRIALKAEKGNVDARLVLARAYMGLGVFDQAQLQAEEAKASKPEDPSVLSVLAVVNVQRAFRTFVRPNVDRKEVLNQIKESLTNAIENRRKALDIAVDAIKPEGATAVAYGDAAIRAGRYSAAVAALIPAFNADQKNNGVANRLAYAQLRLNRVQDAFTTLSTVKRLGSLDAYGFALLGVIYANLGNDAESDNAIREAVLADSEDLGVRTAQTFIALKRNKTEVLSTLASDLAKEQGQRADVRYFQMALATKQQRYQDANRAFQAGVLNEPAMADLYVEYANGAVGLTQRSSMDAKEKEQHYAEARVYFEAALTARPEASEALSGLAMVAIFENKPAEAVKYATAATKAAPGDAGAFYALAAASAAARNAAAAQDANRRAGQLDPKNLGGRSVPDGPAVWRFLGAAGRPTVISAPK